MMRLYVFFCLFLSWQASGLSNPVSKTSMIALTVDSIHHVNCLRATGYLAVEATGGVAPYTYAWSNGNATSVDDDLAPGSYDISVSDSNGDMTFITVEITQDIAAPEANAGADFSAVCTNSIVSLSGTGSSGAEFQYAWTAFNGGIIQSGATTLTPVIRHVGSFVLTVTNTSNGCQKKDTVVVAGNNQPPTVTATGGIFTCAQPLVTLTSSFPSQNTTFIWNGPNGFSSYTLNPMVNVIGTYVLKVTDTLTTCSNTANALVTADTAKPVFPVMGGTITCAQPFVVLSGTATPAGVTFLWSGPFFFSSTIQNPTVITAGTYTVTVTNPTNGCKLITSAVVNSNITPPTAMAGNSGSLTCVNNAVQLIGNGTPAGITYMWTGPNGFTSNQQMPIVNTAGVYTLKTTNPTNGCIATATTTVTTNTTPPGASATGGVRNCNNPTVTLLANSPTPGVSYFWNGPNGFTSTQQNPSATTVGTYTVRVTNPVNGCFSIANATITQNFTPPNVTATGGTINCYTPTPTINANSQTSGATFSWTGPNNFTSNLPNPSVSVTGFYFVTATNPANGCTASTSVFVSENLASPVVNAGDDRYLNCNFSVILTNPIGTSTGNNISYLWTTSDGNIVDGNNSLYAHLDAPGTYVLKVTNTTSGCFKRDSMMVLQKPPLEATTSVVTPISCNGNTNGSIKVVANFGAEIYYYLWSTGHTTTTVSNLGAGTYTCTVTDAQGCTKVSTITLNQPSLVQANVTSTGQTQAGVNNGTATVIPAGGTPPYSILWSNNGTTPTIMNLAPGLYTVTVTDQKGCTKSNTATVNPVNCTISGTTTVNNLNCAGVATGSATANITGAVGPVLYNWSNGGQTQTISNLFAATYTVTATGSNGCTLVLTASISTPSALTLSVLTTTPVTCAGAQNGSASVSANGGTSPYTYHWSNNQNSASATNLAAGTYTCTVTDANDCTKTVTTVITAPQSIIMNVEQVQNVPCVDSQTGSITVNATGGTSPYSFVWSNNAAGATASGLGSGTYTCTVSDVNNCTATQTGQITVTDNTPPQLILQNATVSLNAFGAATVTPAMFDNGSFDASCTIQTWTITPTTFDCNQLGNQVVTLTATDKNGNVATGTANVTITDVQAPSLTCPPDQFASACSAVVTFNAPQVEDNCAPVLNGVVQLLGLPSGSVFPEGLTPQGFQYTDAGGNIATCTFNVVVTSNLEASVAAVPASCSGSCDGTATLTPIGGGTISSAQWSNGQSGLNAVSLCPGVYSVTIMDATGCSKTYSTEILLSDTQAPTIICPSNISVGVCNPIVTFNDPQIGDNCPITMNQVVQIEGLPSGSTFPLGTITESFRVTDGSGNSAQCSFTVTVMPAAGVNVSSTNATCPGSCDGAAIIDAGGATLGVLWSNGAAGPAIANLCAGMYVATIIDGNGCSQTQQVIIAQPQPISIQTFTITHDQGNTAIGSIVITVSGGTMPYTYSWSQDGQYISSAKDIYNLSAGTYTVEITDAKSCTFVSENFVVGNDVVAVDEHELIQWNIYPNPAQSELFIRLDELTGGDEARLEIFDAAGRLLLEQAVQETGIQRVSLSGIPDGMLFVRLNTERGSASKVVFKHE